MRGENYGGKNEVRKNNSSNASEAPCPGVYSRGLGQFPWPGAVSSQLGELCSVFLDKRFLS